MVIKNNNIELELLNEEYEIIADYVRKQDRIQRMKNLINQIDMNENVKNFLLEDDNRLNLYALQLETKMLSEESYTDLFIKSMDSFDINEYLVACKSSVTYRAKLTRAQYADIRDIVYNRIFTNKYIYDVNGVKINLTDIAKISERRTA